MPTPSATTDADLALAAELGQQLRVDSVRSSTSAGSGHPTSSMSAADLMAVLVSRHLRYDWDNPHHPGNDHLIFSKGHASPLLYSIYKAVGVVSDEELMTGYRRFGSRLEGHPTPVLPWVDVATGSLGQGLPDGVGVALAGKYLDELPYRVWVLCGDSEIAEGSIWEALDKASYYKLSNLIAIVDINRLGQRGPTEHEWDTETYRRRVTAFGARAFVIDGHDVAAIDRALAQAGDLSGEQPTVILARTLKGRGFSEVEDKEGWHGKPLPPEMAERAVIELGGERNLLVRGPVPEDAAPRHPARANSAAEIKLPAYDLGQKVATRKAYGDALAAVGARPDVVAMDGEVSNSTFADEFAKAYPERYFEMFIAEQQLVAAAVGFGVRGYRPFASTFAAFFTRAYDFIRMAAISRANICLVGLARRRGDRRRRPVADGAGGPGHAARGPRLHRAVPQRRDQRRRPGRRPWPTWRASRTCGPPGVRTRCCTTPAETFPVGGSKVLRSADDDQVTLIGAGVTLHDCLAAADQLRDEGISARVIDLYSVKPIDTATLTAAAAATGGRLVLAEDHHPEGGLGSAVVDALTSLGRTELAIAHLAVREMPGSGTSEELLDAAGISAGHIAAAARRLLA